jgi:hypothetical protein
MADDNDSQSPEQPAPNPALKSLDRLAGTWNVSGQDIDGQITFEWKAAFSLHSTSISSKVGT